MNTLNNFIKMKRLGFLILSIAFAVSLNAQQYTLDSCRSLTLQNNKKIKEAALRREEARQQKKEAFTNYFPKVSAGAVALKADDYLLKGKIPEANLPVYDGNPINLQNPTQFAYFPGMDINLLDYMNVAYAMAIEPVYMGGQIRNGNKLASVGEQVSNYQYLLTEDEALKNTESRYWTLVSLKVKLNTLDSYDSLLSSLYNDVKVSYDAGLIEKTDLLKVKMKQNELATNRLRLENGIKLVSMALCQNVGIEYSDNIDFVVPENMDEKESISYMNKDAAISNRNEFQMLQSAVKASKLKKRMAVGENLPSLTVGVQGFYLDMMDDENTNAIAVASLNIPISDWWGGSHKIKREKIKIEIAENQLQENMELMGLQIEKAWNELVETQKNIELNKSSVDEAKEHLKVSTDNHKAGIMSTSDLLEAQALYQEAMDNLTDAQCTYRIKLRDYQSAIGTK